MRSTGILRNHWDGLHLRCNVCGADVITLKDGLKLEEINTAWVIHQQSPMSACPAFGAGPVPKNRPWDTAR